MNKTMDEYMQGIYQKCEKKMPNVNKLEKISDYDIIIPTMETADILTQYNYNKEQLKRFAKHYKLKLSGNKKELMVRVQGFLHLSTIVIKIQKYFRGRLQRIYNTCRGPAFLNRALCTNQTDFFTMDDIETLPNDQFFSYRDVDGFVYGFDIISLYNLIKKSKTRNEAKNPYNRMDISSDIILRMRSLIRLSKILKVPMEINIQDISAEISNEKSTELRILDLFQNIDALGNYSCTQWFTSLNRPMLIRFTRELLEIWNYRAQISNETKRAICPPNGDPFRNLQLQSWYHDSSLDSVRSKLVEIMEKLVNTGIDHDSKALGAYYVLGALTIVNDNAASSLPWLYQSFSYI